MPKSAWLLGMIISMGKQPGQADFGDAKRVAMLVALPLAVWERIRDEAREIGVGPSKLIEPVLIQAFGGDREGDA
jgi:hypothetical protein